MYVQASSYEDATDTFWLEDGVPHGGHERRGDERARWAAHADGGVLAVDVKKDNVVAWRTGLCNVKRVRFMIGRKIE